MTPHTRIITVEKLERVAADALRGGYGTLQRWADQDDPRVAGRVRRVLVLKATHNCEDPYRYELFARMSAWHNRRKPPMIIRGSARCRKCKNCMEARGYMWQQRAIAEYKRWPVTAFGTITMGYEQHIALDSALLSGRVENGKVLRHPVDIRTLDHSELFANRVRVFGEELQRYLKRLRKGDALRPHPQIRYLLVAEAHDGARTAVEMRGRPHFHILLHEVEAGSLFSGNPVVALRNSEDGEWIRKKYQSGREWRTGIFLKDDAFARLKWEFGFTKFQFAENERAASYLCKYLTKSTDAKVRASVDYGLSNETPAP